MIFNKNKLFLTLAAVLLFISFNEADAQKVGFISSETIRDKFPEAQAAEQRVQSIVEEWKRELEGMQKRIDDLELEIQKKRLIWSDQEKRDKETLLQNLQTERRTYAREKFETGGEYDEIVNDIMGPVEEKIFAAVQNVSSDQGYDIIWDQSSQPLSYVNFKYDLTVKILKKLGVDVEELEKDLEKKIANDPRNQRRESKRPRRVKRSRDDNSRESRINRYRNFEEEQGETEPEEQGEPEEEEEPREENRGEIDIKPPNK
ncbi:MAG: OmpH family outer membrane protein [Bacteroidota bacterium]